LISGHFSYLSLGKRAKSVQKSNWRSDTLWKSQNLHSFHGGSFRAWLLRIVTNACYDHLRRQKVRFALSLEEVATSPDGDISLPVRADGPEKTVIQRELGERLMQAINRLPVPLRTVLVLADVEGLSYPEIAEAVSIPVGTVKSRLSRARAAVRDELVAARVPQAMGYAQRYATRRTNALVPAFLS
jgi:RNA polymerase sigma-70 factor (ECF subfamily)